MKKLLIILLAFCASVTFAQTADMFNSLGVNLRSDTVINTGTAVLTSRALADMEVNGVTVQINVVKNSGTVGGTITLLGSNDGINFRAVNTLESQTAIPTITAADATASYHYRLQGNYFRFYRVSWAGTGTMNATMSALIYRNRAR